MNLDELKTEVYQLTGRPDMEDITDSMIRAATLKAHHTDYYSKDLWEESVKFPALSYRQQMDYISIVSNFRAFKYFRKAEDACDDAGEFIQIITPDELLDAYGCNRNNVGYVAGRVLEIRSSTKFDRGYLGCYLHPIVKKGEYCSWVAEQYPYAIIYEACRVIFKTIGFDEQASVYQQLVIDEYALLRLSNVQDVGY